MIPATIIAVAIMLTGACLIHAGRQSNEQLAVDLRPAFSPPVMFQLRGDVSALDAALRQAKESIEARIGAAVEESAEREAAIDRLLHERERLTVVITMKSGATFRGALYECDERTVVLRNAEQLTDAPMEPTPVDGELLLPRGEVDFIQRP